jgi:hypothetical protein
MADRPAPSAFAWEEWYAAVGGRSIRIEEVSMYLFEGFTTKLFPTVLMPESPPAVDLPDVHRMHVYPRLGGR